MSLLFPSVCPLCGRALRGREDGLCNECLQDQPLSHLESQPWPNSMEQQFLGHFPLVSAYALWRFYRESAYRPLIHQVKYGGQPRLGRSLGRIAGRQLQQLDFFHDLDCIIPIPLHWLRLWFRGYNQSEWIARGLSDVLHIPLDTSHLWRSHYNTRQALLSREERQTNVRGIFSVHQPEELAGRHVLLLDDVCTSGATLRSAALELLDTVQDIQISIFTLYSTRH